MGAPGDGDAGREGCLFAANYLKGAVHQGLVQVYDDTVPAVVCYTDLWQEELGWWLRRQKENGAKKTLVIKSGDLLGEGRVPKHSC